MTKLLIGACAVYAAFTFLTQPAYESVNVDVHVKPGDTVWTIVDEAMEQTGDDRYILEVIDDTRKINNLTSNDIGNLPVGTVLTVPCKARV